MNYNNKPQVQLRLSRLAYFIAVQIALISGTTVNVQAADYFNPSLLELGAPGQKTVDLSSFENKGGQLPGTYRVDVFLNNESMGTRDVEFQQVKGSETLQPCISVDVLTDWGVLTKRFPEIGTPGTACANFGAVPQVNSDFRFTQQQLLLSFPQSAMNNSARGWIDSKLWNEGIPVALLNYSITGSNNYAKDGHNNDSNSQFVNLRPGINLGPWRLRNYTTWNRSSSNAPNGQTIDKWNTIYTYVQRNIIALKSQFTVGDSSTAAEVFDSISFRGIKLTSDDDMLPESLRGYAPIVRGIARSNAQVTIRQNGYVIYQTYVSPGSFEISDMFPTGGSGDLYVTIKESDGSEQLMVIPFASLPVLQREGRLKFSATTGVYRSYDNNVEKTPLSEGTLIYGLPAGFTIYGGGQFSSKYQSLAAGVGKNLGDFGAMSVDITQSRAKLNDQQIARGQSWRVRYSKNFVSTGTNFSMAGYRYATDGYLGMQEVLDTYTSGNSYRLQERRRNRAELTLSQNLWQGGGNLGITASLEDYWNTNRRMESYGVSYSNSWKGVSYGINYIYNRNSRPSYGTVESGSHGRIYDKDQLFSVNLSVPLSKFFGDEHPIYVSYAGNTSKNGNTNHNVSLNGSALDDSNLNWSVQQGYGTHGQGNNGSVNADWRAAYGQINGGYSYDRNSQRLSYGVQGGILAHENGVTFGQPMGETVALVAAPGAKNVDILGYPGVKTDYRGYAVVPYISPYRKNDVTLDPESFGNNTEVAITTQTVIPTRSAVVRANYQTSVGYRVLMTLLTASGKPIPFGAMVSVGNSKDAGGFIVGDNGQVYLTGLRENGQLKVRWGSNSDEQCTVNYSITDENKGIISQQKTCQ